MDVTPEQRTYSRLAGILFLANYVLQGIGDSVTILARRGESFAETARWAAQSALLYRAVLVDVGAAWIAIGLVVFGARVSRGH